MKKSKKLLLGATVLAALTVLPAATLFTSPVSVSAATVQEALPTAKLTLKDVVAKLKDKVGQGKIAEIELKRGELADKDHDDHDDKDDHDDYDDKDDRDDLPQPHYEVVVLGKENVTFYYLDLNDGKILKEHQTKLGGMSMDIANAKSDILAAAEAAQKLYPKATIKNIQLELNDQRKVVFDVQMIEGNTERELELSADDLSVVKDRAEQADHD